MRLLAHLALAWKGFYKGQCKSVNDRVIRHQISVSLRIYWFLKLLPIVIFLFYQKFVSLLIFFSFVLRLNEIFFINLFQREFLFVTLQQYTIKLLLEEKLSDSILSYMGEFMLSQGTVVIEWLRYCIT